jgi:hypothetical protein
VKKKEKAREGRLCVEEERRKELERRRIRTTVAGLNLSHMMINARHLTWLKTLWHYLRHCAFI